MRLFVTLLFLLMTSAAFGQVNSQRVIFSNADPPTSCVAGKVYTNPALNPAKTWVGTSTGACTQIASGTSISGSGTPGQVAIWNGTNSVAGDSDLTFSTDTLTATKIAGTAFTGPITTDTGTTNQNPVYYRFSSGNPAFSIGIEGSSGAPWLGVGAVQVTGASNVQNYRESGHAVFRFLAGTSTPLTMQIAASGTAGNPITWTNALSFGTSGAATFPAAIINTGITADTAHTDSTVCQDTTTHQFYSGTGAAGICLGTSSLRFKKDVRPYTIGLAPIMALRPIQFHYISGYGDSGAREQVGLAAEDVAKVLPSMVGRDADGRPQSVDYGALFPLLINAVQEQQREIDSLQKEVHRLRRRR
jgi:hypothetical protein